MDIGSQTVGLEVLLGWGDELDGNKLESKIES